MKFSADYLNKNDQSGGFHKAIKLTETWQDMVFFIDPFKYRRFQPVKAAVEDKEWHAVRFSTYKKRFVQRGLGFHALNMPFEGCEGHHINANDVIFIPKEMHKSMYHCLRTGKKYARDEYKSTEVFEV